MRDKDDAKTRILKQAVRALRAHGENETADRIEIDVLPDQRTVMRLSLQKEQQAVIIRNQRIELRDLKAKLENN